MAVEWHAIIVTLLAGLAEKLGRKEQVAGKIASIPEEIAYLDSIEKEMMLLSANPPMP